MAECKARIKMTEFRSSKKITNSIFLAGGVLLLTYFFAGDELTKQIPGYVLLKNILMIVVILFLFILRPRIDKYVLVTLLILLVRFFIGDYLKAKTSWYLLVSFPITVFLIGFLIVREFVMKSGR